MAQNIVLPAPGPQSFALADKYRYQVMENIRLLNTIIFAAEQLENDDFVGAYRTLMQAMNSMQGGPIN